MEYVKMYLIAFIIFLAIDAIWLGLVAPKFYKAQIGHLMADKPNLLAFSIIITLAFGKSIPTSIIVVETNIEYFLLRNL